MVCFSGPVDVTTLRNGVSITAVDSDRPSIGINQVIFDPAGMCAYAKPDRVLDQQTRYLLAVTADVADADGKEFDNDIVALAMTKGSGWVDYRMTNPLTKKVERKSSWVRRVGDYVVFVGAYRS